MTTKIETNGNTVTAFLSGEIDHHNAPKIRQAIDESIAFNQPGELILDFNDVSFMDSSGIGLVMGRYALVRDKGCSLVIRNLSEHCYIVMRLAGLEKIAVLKRKQEIKK